MVQLIKKIFEIYIAVDVPILLAPAKIIFIAVSLSLIPPEALTPKFSPTTPLNNATSNNVAPYFENPVEVLTNLAPLSFTILQAIIFLHQLINRFR
jgi:hypothetical protein